MPFPFQGVTPKYVNMLEALGTKMNLGLAALGTLLYEGLAAPPDLLVSGAGSPGYKNVPRAACPEVQKCTWGSQPKVHFWYPGLAALSPKKIL